MEKLIRSLSYWKVQTGRLRGAIPPSHRPPSADKSLGALKQAVYEAFDAMLDGEKHPYRREKLANAYRAACDAYLEAKSSRLAGTAKRPTN
jgi:hypothetical protein